MFRSRNMFMYEVPEDGGGAPAGGGEAQGGGWQPTEEWGRRIDSFIESAQPTLSVLGEVLSAPEMPDDGGYGQYDPYQQGQQPMFDPYTGQPLAPDYQQGLDPRQIQQMIEQQAQQLIDQRLGAYEPLLGQIAEREGEQIARARLADLQNEVGAFSEQDAIVAAQGYIAQGMDAEEALRMAAAYAHQRQEEIGQQAVEAYKASLRNAATATGDLGVGGAAVEIPGTPAGPGRYEAAVARHLERGLTSPSDL